MKLSNVASGMASISKKPKILHSEYAEGAIVRIKLENFVTHDAVEFSPGPHFNLIIGPNASGKSSIVCAICLGLGGKTSILGRAQNAPEFIKHNTQKAVIEIQLHNKQGEDYVIRREIHRSGTNNWMINNQPAQLRTVEQLTQRLKIQVGNLCQFLPQDKVADFAKLSEQQLLEKTEEAVGLADMYENHMKLKEARDTEKKLELTHGGLAERLEREEATHSRQEQDVANFNQRRLHMDRVRLLKRKKPWVEYDQQRVKFNQEKAKKESLIAELKKMRSENGPDKEKLEASRNKERELNAKMASQQDQIKKSAEQTAAVNKDMEKMIDKQAEIQNHLDQKQQDEATRLRRLHEVEEQLAHCMEELTVLDSQDVQDIAPQLQQVTTQMTQANRQLNTLQQRQEEEFSQMEASKRELSGAQASLCQLLNVHNRRLDALRQQSKDAYQAVFWLRDNKHRFKAPVHEPIMLVLNASQSSYAAYLESQIPFKDFFTFVSEDSDDHDLLMRTLRKEQDLRVNLALMPPPSRIQPKHPISHYEQYGFQHYLSDMFDCPPGVKHYLCVQYHLHAIPVGNAKTRKLTERVIAECPEFRTFFTEQHKVTVRQSKYGNRNTSTMTSSLRAAKLLALTVDSSRENQLKRDVTRLEEKIRKHEQAKQKIRTDQDKLELELNQFRTEKKRLTERKSVRSNLKLKIENKQQSIQKLQSQGVDMEAEKRAVERKLKALTKEKIRHLLQMKEHTRRCMKQSMKKVELCLEHASVIRQSSQLELTLREHVNKLHTLESSIEDQMEVVRSTKTTAKKLLEEALAAVDLQPGQELTLELRKAFELLPETVDEINAQIHEEQARADCTMSVEARVIEEYEKRRKRIQQLKKESVESQKNLDDHRQEIEVIKQEWLTPLNELVNKINSNYSSFFKRLNCAGEVDLHVPDNPEDYDKYGIRIKVKFRACEQLKELNAFHQSGGERSVATVLYMMALQELTQVPFRCVDEINQGMDPENERRIFELVMHTACNRHTSQYFLLTPKLLPHLEYDDNVTVMCVFNGPNMLHHKHWDVKSFVRRRERFAQSAN